ncbi:O-antigen polymerase [Thalassotalea sp. G2M2-11]|uniref:O-antigen polymerase n=1 Tax=Thalassotalea sp. G2M2-11 TaxID=2787627 RepID=UPI0019CF606C|nr:O-antigen polymerase [Thalassotalea sp. G2M2-11]
MAEYLYLYASILAITLRGVWEVKYFKGRISPLLIYSICYFYFCYGPYIAFLLDIPIYSGINKAMLPQSAFVFFLAILTLSAVPSNLMSRITSNVEIVIKRPQFFRQITILTMTIPVIVIFIYAFLLIGFNPLDKVEKIRLVGIFHYVLLTLWPIFLFCYMTISPYGQITKQSKLFIASIILIYCFYCLYMGERDFALIFVPIYFWLHKDKRVSMFKLCLMLSLGAIGFTLMSSGRSVEIDSSGIGAFLNQGSNLMVTSNILFWLEHDLQLWWGESYLSSLLNMLTLGALKITLPLSIWFSREYSPFVNDGAYGFSLEAEVLLNFGVIGIPIVFAIIGILISAAFKGYRNDKPFGTLMTYFILFYFIYAIRGESLIIFKSFSYCCIIFFFLLYVSQRGKFYFKK